MCRERDLHVSGTKNDLINNLIRWKSNLPSTLKKKGNVKKELFVNNNNTNIATTNNSRVAALKEMYGFLKNSHNPNLFQLNVNFYVQVDFLLNIQCQGQPQLKYFFSKLVQQFISKFHCFLESFD